MKQCCHCCRTYSPCWRKGPPEKPVLCNACGAHFLCKRSLENYWPKEAAVINQQPYVATEQQQNRQQRQKRTRCLDTEQYAPAAVLSKRPWLQQREALQTDSGLSSMSQPSSSQSDDVAMESTSPRSGSKRPRLVSCHVYEVDPQTATALRLLKTFETADGVVITVIRRPRKQACPRACAVM